MLKHYILDPETHQPIEVDVMRWARWSEDTTQRIVDYTQITSDCFVSTVFLGMDHRFTRRGRGPPILFETMIFGGPKDIDEFTWRYSSWDDAVTGHKAAVRKAREALGQRITQQQDC